MQVFRFATIAATALLLGCSAAAPKSSSPVGQQASSSEPRVLTLSIAREPTFIAALAPLPSQQASDFYVRAFNAFLDLYDDQGRSVPYLTEALPVLNTDS